MVLRKHHFLILFALFSACKSGQKRPEAPASKPKAAQSKAGNEEIAPPPPEVKAESTEANGVKLGHIEVTNPDGSIIEYKVTGGDCKNEENSARSQKSYSEHIAVPNLNPGSCTMEVRKCASSNEASCSEWVPVTFEMEKTEPTPENLELQAALKEKVDLEQQLFGLATTINQHLTAASPDFNKCYALIKTDGNKDGLDALKALSEVSAEELANNLMFDFSKEADDLMNKIEATSDPTGTAKGELEDNKSTIISYMMISGMLVLFAWKLRNASLKFNDIFKWQKFLNEQRNPVINGVETPLKRHSSGLFVDAKYVPLIGAETPLADLLKDEKVKFYMEDPGNKQMIKGPDDLPKDVRPLAEKIADGKVEFRKTGGEGKMANHRDWFHGEDPLFFKRVNGNLTFDGKGNLVLDERFYNKANVSEVFEKRGNAIPKAANLAERAELKSLYKKITKDIPRQRFDPRNQRLVSRVATLAFLTIGIGMSINTLYKTYQRSQGKDPKGLALAGGDSCDAFIEHLTKAVEALNASKPIKERLLLVNIQVQGAGA